MVVGIMLRGPPACEAVVSAVIERHGGAYVIRAGVREVLEGQWQPSRLLRLRFHDRGARMNGPDHLPFKVLRQRVADTESMPVGVR